MTRSDTFLVFFQIRCLLFVFGLSASPFLIQNRHFLLCFRQKSVLRIFQSCLFRFCFNNKLKRSFYLEWTKFYQKHCLNERIRFKIFRVLQDSIADLPMTSNFEMTLPHLRIASSMPQDRLKQSKSIKTTIPRPFSAADFNEAIPERISCFPFKAPLIPADTSVAAESKSFTHRSPNRVETSFNVPKRKNNVLLRNDEFLTRFQFGSRLRKIVNGILNRHFKLLFICFTKTRFFKRAVRRWITEGLLLEWISFQIQSLLGFSFFFWLWLCLPNPHHRHLATMQMKLAHSKNERRLKEIPFKTLKDLKGNKETCQSSTEKNKVPSWKKRIRNFVFRSKEATLSLRRRFNFAWNGCSNGRRFAEGACWSLSTDLCHLSKSAR